MTTNAGAANMQKIFNKRIGFLAGPTDVTPDIIKQMTDSALHAIKKEFPPEFCNRIDDIIVFLPLRQSAVAQVMELEIAGLQSLLLATNPLALLFHCGEKLKEHLLALGFNMEYGARNMRRTVNNILAPALVNILLNGELDPTQDYVVFDCDSEGTVCAFADGSANRAWIAERRQQLLEGVIVPPPPSPASVQPGVPDRGTLLEHPAMLSLIKAHETLARGLA